MRQNKYANNRRPSTIAAKFFVGLALTMFSYTANAQEAVAPEIGAPIRTSSEWSRFREALKRAKPIPEPKPDAKAEGIKASGDMMQFDLVTQKVSKLASAKVDAKGMAVMREPGQPGVMPKSADGQPHVIVGEGPESLGVIDSDNKSTGPREITPTPPTPMKEPYVFKPYRTHFKLIMRFPVPNNSDQFFSCSASSTSSFHLLTAAHCIYNHDPLGDGSGKGAGYATEIWAWPSQTDTVDPLGGEWTDFPWGVAKVTRSFAYESWVISRNFEFDFGILTMDRRIGDHIGWMQRETGVFATTLLYSGYPTEEPYVPWDTPYQYPGGNNGNVKSYVGNRINLAAYTYGGHSGGAAFRCCNGSEYIFQGVSSTSDRMGNAFYTLFNSQMNLDLINIINKDRQQRAPVDRAELIEYVFDNYSKGLGVLSVNQGAMFDLVLNAMNAGHTASGAVTADVFLTKRFDTLGATYVGSVPVITNMDPNSYTIQYKQLRLPNTVQPGEYFVGWTLRSANAQYGTANPNVLMTKRRLRVVGLSAIGVNTASVVGGTPVTGTVYLSGPAPQIGLGTGTDVLMSSNRPAVQPAGPVHFNVDQMNANFVLATTPVAQNTTATITANLNGVTRTTIIQIKPASLNALAVAPQSVVGGKTSTATIDLNGPAPAGGMLVTLKSSSPKAVVPASIRVNAGATSVTVVVKTSAVAANTTASIKATLGGITKTASLTITRK